MIKLFQLTGYWGIPSPSPFCMKLETYLRMSQINFESIDIRSNVVALKNKIAPKGKIPFVEIDGQVIGDSSIIVGILKKRYGDKLDSKLSLQQIAQSVTIQRMFEDHYFWSIVYSRWFDHDVWKVTRLAFFDSLPWYKKNYTALLRKRNMKKMLYYVGIGRHSEDEIYNFAQQDLISFATLLSDKPFFHGDEPSSIDAVAFAFLVNTLYVPFENSIKEFAKQFPQFTLYCQRIANYYYPDLKLPG